MNSTQKPVPIVTGASSGIGLGVTQALIKHGHGVVGTSLSISKSKELKPSSDLVLIEGDISKKETTVKVAAAAMKTALACSLAIWITYTYGWPGPYWSCLAIVLSRHADRSASRLLFSKQSGGVALGTPSSKFRGAISNGFRGCSANEAEEKSVSD